MFYRFSTNRIPPEPESYRSERLLIVLDLPLPFSTPLFMRGVRCLFKRFLSDEGNHLARHFAAVLDALTDAPFRASKVAHR